MKKTFILFFICVMWSCNNKDVFAPDKLFYDEGTGLYVANRSANELLRFNPDLQTSDKKTIFESPVNDLEKMPDKSIWVVCDGYEGKLYELNAVDLKIISKTEIGNSPSAIQIGRASCRERV